MKDVNKLIIGFIVFLCFSCNQQKKNTETQLSNVIDFDRDSLIYNIDISESKFNPTSFLVLKCIYVGEHFIGSYSDENFKKAYQYKDEKRISEEPFIRYFIKQKKDGKYSELWTVKEPINTTSSLQLCQGATISNQGVEDYFLKIVSHQYGSLGCYAINFKLYDKKWSVLSKERIVTDSFYNKTIGYCIDKTNKRLNYPNDGEKLQENEIDFSTFDKMPDARWDCK
ncbi:hypothetical protein [Flavobacterium sp. UBA7682]|uniref:hypothetical protein n=1 Tax=Flavobacterium sp. UBA7682 TaxID=1946560 RepID=UPI0025C274B2|nr:hypothetical protein [Flavobacterium sp. UBA7682]